MVLHGSRTWSIQMIGAGVSCRWFIVTVQVQMIHKVDRINVLWVPAQWSNTTFHKLFAMFYMVHAHGRCRWLMCVFHADDSLRRSRHRCFTMSNTQMHSECPPNNPTPRFRSFLQRFYMVHARGRCRSLMQVVDVEYSLRRFRHRCFTRSNT